MLRAEQAYYGGHGRERAAEAVELAGRAVERFEGEGLDYIGFRVELLARDAENALAALEGAEPPIEGLQFRY